MEEERPKGKKAENWDLFANINSDGMEWAGEEEKKRKEEEEAKRKEEDKKAEEEEKRKRGVVHGVEILHVEEAHCRKKATPSDWKSSNQHFHLECLCPKVGSGYRLIGELNGDRGSTDFDATSVFFISDFIPSP